ncbi:DUF2399 domain-containing protein [Streptomyces sp. K1PA1]|uniref:DUF2399 domain-containing protein n=1 Tax=Streptomyces tropicalis TaxID=3034234 RepID=A0ABT6A5W3_9ACTN|nr:DUF2399 domain-containing protein [Streptomyces tropicalis]
MAALATEPAEVEEAARGAFAVGEATLLKELAERAEADGRAADAARLYGDAIGIFERQRRQREEGVGLIEGPRPPSADAPDRPRRPRAVRTMAVLGLARTPSAGGPARQPARWWELGELAAHITGDAHGLDEGRLAGTLTLKGIAAACGLPGSESSAGRRLLWEQVGVSADMLSGTVIVWKLAPPGPDPWASMMRARGDLGLATHLTMHELRTAAVSAPLAAPQTTVRWCENPQVLQAAARYGLPGVLVCGSGNPSSAGWELLQRLLTDGAHVLYHGDFDWAGITIAERVLRLGAYPWRMSAADYLTALAYLSTDRLAPLAGEPVATPWDPRLEQAMSEKGLAVHEEALLPRLLADLSG